MELAAYAAGRLDESMRRPVAQHLTQCEECRAMAGSLNALAEHLRAGGEELFAPHPSSEELRDFSKKATAASEPIASHLEICATCDLEVEAWSRMGEKATAAASAENVAALRRREKSGRGTRALLAAAAGVMLGIGLGYLARERLAGFSARIPALPARVEPSVEQAPRELLRIGPQLLLPRPLRGEPTRLTYAIRPQQDGVIMACPAALPEASPSGARFRFELLREGGERVWSQEMTASDIRDHREQTGVVTLLVRADLLRSGLYEFKLVDVDRPDEPLYHTPLEFSRLSGEAP